MGLDTCAMETHGITIVLLFLYNLKKFNKDCWLFSRANEALLF